MFKKCEQKLFIESNQKNVFNINVFPFSEYYYGIFQVLLLY